MISDVSEDLNKDDTRKHNPSNSWQADSDRSAKAGTKCLQSLCDAVVCLMTGADGNGNIIPTMNR